VRVGVVVVGEDAVAGPLQGVADARGAAEEVDDRAGGRGCGADLLEDRRDQQPLGSEVLDQGESLP
jgi:hypothetical protein